MNKNTQLLKELIDKMFQIAGHDVRYEDVVDRKDEWYWEYTMTEEQNKEWREWGTAYLRKKKRMNKVAAGYQMAWLDLYCGLKIAPVQD